METVVFILMVLVCFNYMLKQTHRKTYAVIVSAAVCALFTGAMQPFAIEQSKARIADWLADPALMLDTAVILTVEVVLQMAYCLLAVRVQTAGRLRRRTIVCYRILRWFPGILIFPVLFSGLVTVIFALPGVSFTLIAWSTAAGVCLLIPAGTLLLRRLLPERELRLELLFLSNALVAVLGVIATVNGRTAVTAESAVDWGALAGVAATVALGAAAGLLLRRIRLRRNRIRTYCKQ